MVKGPALKRDLLLFIDLFVSNRATLFLEYKEEKEKMGMELVVSNC
jgi:hypothetical protein